MSDFFASMSDSEIFVFLCVTSVIGSILAVLLLRWTNPVRLSYRDNAMIGTISSVIGVIYGVLVGLTALYLINSITATSDAVEREANAVANLNRDTLLVEEPLKHILRAYIRNYASDVVNIEWPAMQKGDTLNNKGEMVIESMAKEIVTHVKGHPNDTLIAGDMLQEIKALYNARDQRIGASQVDLSPEMWFVIIIGSILTVSINYFFKMNLYLHLVGITFAALITASMVFLLVTLNKPFQGEFVIQPDAFKGLLHHMDVDPQ